MELSNMRCSEINARQRQAKAFIRRQRFCLSLFAAVRPLPPATGRKQSVGFSELVEARLVGRFPEIEADPAPFHLLVSD